MNTPYQSLIEAARSLDMLPFLEDLGEVDMELVPEFFEVNAPHLDLAREALDRKPSVTVEFNWDWYSQWVESFGPLRNLVNAFCLEMRLAKHRGELALAADIAIDGMELSNAVRRGGLIVGAQVSLGIAAQICEPLRRIRVSLADRVRVGLIEQLARIENEREPFSVILKRDQDWTKGVDSQPAQESDDFLKKPDSGKSGSEEENLAELMALVKPLLELPPAQLHSIIGIQDQLALALLRMLRLDLALRSHQEEHGEYPETLEKLVPGRLEEIPSDPFTGKSFLYRKKSDIAFDLYSPAPGGTDHGGQFGSLKTVMAGHGDYCLDYNDYDDEC